MPFSFPCVIWETMFHCKCSMCEHVSERVISFNQHKNVDTPNYHYQCGIPDSSQMYHEAAVLKMRMCETTTNHQHPCWWSSLWHCKTSNTPLKCVSQSCAFKCDTLTSFVKHFKPHIKKKDWKRNAHSEVATAAWCPVLSHMFQGNMDA